MIDEIDMATHRPRTRMVLAIGDSGTGKTHFIGTAPKPLMVFSFDQGFDTIAMKPGIKVASIQEKDRKTPKAWQEFKARFAKWLGGEEYTWPDGRKEKYKSVALDGVGPFLCDYCMNHYQFMGSNVDKKATYTQYQQLLENMTDVFNDCKRATEYVICTALTKVDKDEDTGAVLILPNLTGQIRDQLAAKFDAVFFFYTDRKITTSGTEEIYAIKTVAGYREKGKIRLPAEIKNVIAPIIQNPNFEEILRMIDAKVESVYGNLPPAPTAELKPSEESGPIPPRPVAQEGVGQITQPAIKPSVLHAAAKAGSIPAARAVVPPPSKIAPRPIAAPTPKIVPRQR